MVYVVGQATNAHLLCDRSNPPLSLNDALVVAVPKHRGYKAARCRNSDADIGVVPVGDCPLVHVERRVDLWDISGGQCGRLCECPHEPKTHSVLFRHLRAVLIPPCQEIRHINVLVCRRGCVSVLRLLEIPCNSHPHS